MISSIAWVPQGVADPNPKKYELSATEQELVKMMEKQSMNEGDQEEEEVEEEEEEVVAPPKKDKQEKKEETSAEDHGLPADLRMDEYSSDEDENDAVRGTALGNLLVEDDLEELEELEEDEELEEEDEEEQSENDSPNPAHSDMDSDSESSDSDDDLADVPDTREYTPIDVEGLTAMGLSQVGSNAPMYMEDNDEEEDDSIADDVKLGPDDAIIVVAKTEEDFASLEIHVYEQKTGNLFVHHDIPLPAFPLCLAHGDISPIGGAGNFCAVGTFSPGIEIWNLDVLNALEPSCVLGGEDTTMADDIMKATMMGKKNTKQMMQGPSLRQGSHTDAVMALSWNKVHRQLIASGSADCTVKLWDITNGGKCESGTFSHHNDKVQSVVWHPTEGTLLATGSYDRTVALVDARASGDNVKRTKIPADCETLAWDPFNSQYLTAASEDGSVLCWDVRKFTKPVWSFVANEYGGVSDLAYNSLVPGMLVTCAVDKTVTLWDTYQDGKLTSQPPRACANKNMNVGKLYSVGFYPSTPWLLGCAGSGKELALWDMSAEAILQKRFGSRVGAEHVTSSDAPIDEGTKQDDFKAMMTADVKLEGADEETEKKTMGKNKKKKEKKKMAHRAGR